MVPRRLCQLSQLPWLASEPSQPPSVEPAKTPIQMRVFELLMPFIVTPFLAERPTVVAERADLAANFEHGECLVVQAHLQPALFQNFGAVAQARK